MATEQRTVNALGPDIETASADYASRFSGRAGEFLLGVQDMGVAAMISEFAGGTLLDVGGGHGQLLGLYDDLGIKACIHGSDDQCFARLPRDRTEFDTVASDIRSLPFDDDAFDVVLAVRLISHMADWETALAEMCRVARCAIVIDYPSKHSLNALTPVLFQLKRGFEKNTRRYTSFRRQEIASVCAAQGFCSVVEYKQFVVPMVIHRALNGSWLSHALENTGRTLGLTRLFGSTTGPLNQDGSGIRPLRKTRC